MAGPMYEAPTESAVVDEAHLGDIRGAFGSLRWRQLWPARTRRRRLAVLAAVMGPGLLALIADNDAGGVATYAQAGQERGLGLLWVLLPLGVVLFLNQEMAARLGAVSGVGHARLIFERFGRLWGAFSLGDLLVLNLLTLLTEFIGVRIAAEHLGLPPAAAVAGSAAVLIVAALRGGFRRWERVMYLLVALDVALLPVLFLAQPAGHPGAAGVVSGGSALHSPVVLVVALLGTTVAPWQLFFQQSLVVDKRITPRWMGYARFDTALGTLLMLAGAAAVIVVSAAAFSGGPDAAARDVGGVLATVGTRLGSSMGNVLALLLLDGAVLGAAAVTLATSYALGDVSGARHSLHRTPGEAPMFYAVTVGLVALAAGVVLVPSLPLGFTTTAVQVLAGLLLPGAATFMLLLCNDTAVLGPWVNGRWHNAITAACIAGLLALSAMLVVTALFPAAPVRAVGTVLGGVAAAGLLGVAAGATAARRRVRRLLPQMAETARLRVLSASEVVVMPRRPPRHIAEDLDRATWRTPPLAELRRPVWTRGRVIAMVALRGYVLASLLLLAGRAVASALGH
ncbi:MAG TPA: NRAMP family divalent metal transporter [Candidatus Dormibacteraeota bacterium]|nr:NRAMP family divalent metal transporter [Candidatus Dormibacteraeota bacterium]